MHEHSSSKIIEMEIIVKNSATTSIQKWLTRIYSSLFLSKKRSEKLEKKIKLKKKRNKTLKKNRKRMSTSVSGKLQSRCRDLQWQKRKEPFHKKNVEI